MGRGLRGALWILSSLAVLWIVLALIGLFTMGGMMGCCGMMGGGMMGDGMMDGMMHDSAAIGGMMGDSGMTGGMHGGGMAAQGMMGGGMMLGMMFQMVLTWLVMLGLVGVFVYLVVTARRARPAAQG